MKSKIHKIILLQLKFFVVAFLNLTYNLVPNPFRKFYLLLFGIKVVKIQRLISDVIWIIDEVYLLGIMLALLIILKFTL